MGVFKLKRFLVTGASGDIGFNIARIIRECYPESIIYCADVHRNVPIDYLNAKLMLLPWADNDDYLAILEELVDKYGIDCVIPTSETELRFLTEKESFISRSLQQKLIWASRLVRLIGFDKFKTTEFLKEMGFANLNVELNSDGLPSKYPCIYKSRTGAGGDAVFKVEDIEQAYHYKKIFPEYIWQSFVNRENGEHTACLFSDGNTIRSIIFERTLSGGISRTAKVIQNSEYTNYIEKIGETLKFKGSINIQFRSIGSTPFVFEINPRFSSTVKMRDIMGFSDLIWSLELMKSDHISPYNLDVRSISKTIYRLNSEYIQ
jgi:carbamoyl-phosphate synthase large subunit